MTGQEFEQALNDAGYTHVAFARIMGVHRQLIGRLCDSDEVKPHWVFALAMLISLKSVNDIEQGFTTLSDEVRDLATRVAVQSEQITAGVQSLHQAAQDALATMNKTSTRVTALTAAAKLLADSDTSISE